jgi:hypothetical protein
LTRHLQQQTPRNDEITNTAANLSWVPAPIGSGPYLPIWQISPVVPMKPLLNLNALVNAVNTLAYREVLRTGQAVVDAATNLKGEIWVRLGYSGK